MKARNWKWLALLVSLLYPCYAAVQLIGRDTRYYDYLSILGNWLTVILIAAWLIKSAKVKDKFDLAVLVAFILYLFVLHNYVTYINLAYYFNADYIGNHHILKDRINLIPFYTIGTALTTSEFDFASLKQVVGNLILLTPFAFALLGLSITRKAGNTLLFIFFLSAGIELYQFGESYIMSAYQVGDGRATDIDDVILNTAGGFLGILLYRGYQRIHRHLLQSGPGSE